LAVSIDLLQIDGNHEGTKVLGGLKVVHTAWSVIWETPRRTKHRSADVGVKRTARGWVLKHIPWR